MLACLLLGAGWGERAVAHDIPPDVTLQAFVHPHGRELDLLVRVPLEAMQDMSFPTTGPGYLDLERVEPQLREAAMLWIADNVRLFEDGVPLPEPSAPLEVRVSLPSDRSFVSYEQALAHLSSPPLENDSQLMWRQALFDAHFRYPIRSDRSRFSIRPSHARLGMRVTTVLRFVLASGVVRAFEYRGDPGLVRLDPSWFQAARRFAVDGVRHILGGADHLLFLACLVIPLRRVRALVPVVTAFTVAHSLTLIGSAYGLAPPGLWFPPLVELLIAVSIVYMALENVFDASIRHRWVVAFGFGLVHGFGFSFALRESLQFSGSHLLTSLLAFNVGVELGQLTVLALLVPALTLLIAATGKERTTVVVLSVLVGHTAWHWMIDRAILLDRYRPALEAAAAELFSGATLVVMTVLLAAVVAAGWALRRRRRSAPSFSASSRPLDATGLGAPGER